MFFTMGRILFLFLFFLLWDLFQLFYFGTYFGYFAVGLISVHACSMDSVFTLRVLFT